MALCAGLVWALNAHADQPGGTSTERRIVVDGLERSYIAYVPGGFDRPLPVVFAFHGGGGNPRQMERYSRFDSLAQRDGFVVIYPSAVDGNWNDGRGVAFMRAQRENIDDVKFVRAIIDEVAKTASIDRSRIFACGISNGGFFSHRLAAEASDMVAGIAPVVGGMAPAIYEKFRPQYPVSILIIQGDADPLVPLHGGDVRFGAGRSRGKLVDTDRALAKYVERNGNPGKPTTTQLVNKPDVNTSVDVTKYSDGPGGFKTEYYLIHGGGHAWPGRAQYARESMIGKASQDFDASETIWKFFRNCPSRTK